LIDQATTFAGMWPILNEEERRKLVDELVERVELQKEKLHFVLTYTPPFIEVRKGVHTPVSVEDWENLTTPAHALLS